MARIDRRINSMIFWFSMKLKLSPLQLDRLSEFTANLSLVFFASLVMPVFGVDKIDPFMIGSGLVGTAICLVVSLFLAKGARWISLGCRLSTFWEQFLPWWLLFSPLQAASVKPWWQRAAHEAFSRILMERVDLLPRSLPLEQADELLKNLTKAVLDIFYVREDDLRARSLWVDELEELKGNIFSGGHSH